MEYSHFNFNQGISVTPEIYVSVVAQGCNAAPFNKVLLQGCLLTAENVRTILGSLKKKLRRLENDAAKFYQKE